MNGKQLKNSILQWAIQGKLVPQDPNDEPASVLLERIRAEKARLVKEGKIKKDKNESIIFRGDDNSHYEKFLATGEVKCIDEDIPFEIPEGWEWAKLNDVCSYIQRGKSPVYSEIRQYPVIAQKCNQWSGFSIENAQFISPETVEKYSEERILRQGDLLWNSTGLGTLGRIAVYIEALNPYQWAVADSHVTVIRPMPTLINSYFLYTYFASPTVQSVIEDKAEGSTKQKELYVDTIKNYIVPVPPFAEQCRIIEKLKNIRPFISIYSKTQEKLDSLNSDLHSRLKKSILQEAIQGRLVPQDPSDEPTSELLKRIREEKLRLVKEGKLKKKDITDSVIFTGDDNRHYEKIGDQIIDISEDIPLDIPDSWSWVRLRNICSIMTGATFKKEDARHDNQGIRVLRGGNILPFEIKSKDDDIFLSPDCIKQNILLKQNDLITPAVTSLENICKMARAEKDMPTTTVGGFVFILRPYYDLDSISIYLLEALSSPVLIEFVKSITNKSGQAFYNIGKERLGAALIPLPPIKEQERINDRIKLLWNNLR